MSLSALGNVIRAITNRNTKHIPYRNSKLTRILKESLCGNYKTTLIINWSPNLYHLDESISSIMFGLRAKKIKNAVWKNIESVTIQNNRIYMQLV